MKQCPTCQSQYTDDTLQFCLQDGAPLRPVSSAQSNTIAFNEQQTVASNRQSDQINAPHITNPTDWAPNQFQSNPDVVRTPEKKSNATVAVFATAFVMLLLFSVVGVGLWLFMRGVSDDPNKNILLAKREERDTQSANKSSITSKTPPQPMATVPSRTGDANVATNSAPVDKEQTKRDIAQRIDSWKQLAEARNFDQYMTYYADTVDYYNKKGASRAAVRADKQRAFTNYDSIKITHSNLVITPDAAGEMATAVYDKEWVFDGAKYSAGKVQSELKLKKINGNWLITGERDLKVYYTN